MIYPVYSAIHATFEQLGPRVYAQVVVKRFWVSFAIKSFSVPVLAFKSPNIMVSLRLECLWYSGRVVSKTKHSKTNTEARSTQISKTKHPKLENGAPKSRKRSTQNSKGKHPKLETCLSFKNTRQSLVKSPAAGIKHDNK